MEVLNIRISFKSNKFKKRNNSLVSETFSSFEGRCKKFSILIVLFVVPLRVLYASKMY